MKNLMSVLLVFLLASCASAPKLSTQAIEIPFNNLPQYWLVQVESFSFTSPGKNTSRPEGYVKVRFLIDSNGKVFNSEIVESMPLGVWDDHGLRAVQELQYLPAEKNTARRPVYVTTTFKFKGT